MQNKGTLETIWIKRAKLGPMDRTKCGKLVTGQGLVGNANQGGKRQVTLIENEAWERMMAELDAGINPSARRANLLLSGISLKESRGKTLKVGPCRLLIHGETRPCERMDQALQGLREAMQKDWGGGAFAEVLDDGDIAVGDEVTWVETAG